MLERKRNNLSRNDERKATQHNNMQEDQYSEKRNKENTTRQQMKLIDKPNQAKKVIKFENLRRKAKNNNENKRIKNR